MERGELMFAESTDAGQVFAALSERYLVRAEPATSGRWTCLDTADWRLHKNGMTLRDARQGHRAAQLLLTAGKQSAITGPSFAGKWPRRADTLPPSAVRARVEPAAGIRALL